MCILPSGVQMRMVLCLAYLLACRSFDTFTFCIKCEWLYCLETTLDDVVCSMYKAGDVVPLLSHFFYRIYTVQITKLFVFFFLYIFNLLKFHLFYLFTHQNRREKQETKKATTQLKFVFGISRYFSYILGTCILYKCRSHVQLH